MKLYSFHKSALSRQNVSPSVVLWLANKETLTIWRDVELYPSQYISVIVMEEHFTTLFKTVLLEGG